MYYPYLQHLYLPIKTTPPPLYERMNGVVFLLLFPPFKTLGEYPIVLFVCFVMAESNVRLLDLLFSLSPTYFFNFDGLL